ncbi:MAG: hypothetical protein B6I20_01610 [Bacteroidetes bacterium 4572_117]|nr:MAG: hypothetical protein B6I20_01610 [Bacteroidetes bacterium 4572_117]
MNYKEVAKQAINLFVPALAKSKARKHIKNDFSEAINNEILDVWGKIRPIFIEEIEDETIKFENITEDTDANEAIQYELRKLLKKNDGVQKTVNELIKKTKKINPGITKENTVTVTGNDNTIFQYIKGLNINISGNRTINHHEEKSTHVE